MAGEVSLTGEGVSLIPGSGGGGGGSITVTDGSTTVSSVTTIDFTSGATVTDGGGGTANVAVSGGITGSGTATHLPVWTSASAIGDSGFIDLGGTGVTVSLTNTIPDVVGPGLIVQGAYAGFMVENDGSDADGYTSINARQFGNPDNAPGFFTLTYGGTKNVPLPLGNGITIGSLIFFGNTDGGLTEGFTFTSSTQSDWSAGGPYLSDAVLSTSTASIRFEPIGAISMGFGSIGAAAAGDLVVQGDFRTDGGIVVAGGGIGTTTAVAGAATLDTRSGIVTSEALVGATTYALTLTNSFIVAESVILLTCVNSDGLVTWPASIVPGAGSTVITVGMAALTGTVSISFTVINA